MNTRYIAKEYRMSHWAKIITDQKESGLTIREYCEKNGLHENSYYYWQKKLRTAAIDELTTATDEQAQELVPIMAKLNLTKNNGSELTGIGSNDYVSIEMFGIRLTASRDYPIAKLSELLRVVSRL
jgi:phage terminase large subunit-like protein